MICDPRCGLSWRMFHVHLRRRCILLYFGWNVLKISMRSISSNVSFKTCVHFLIFCFDDLSIGVSLLLTPLWVHWYSLLLLLCYCQFLLLCLLVFVLCIEVLLCWVYRYLQLLCLPLYWSLDHYVVSFLISCNILYFKVYFFWGLLFHFSFASHLHQIYFSIFSLSVYMCL